MDWGVGGREFAGGVSDWERFATARITAETQRAQRKATAELPQRHRDTEKRERFNRGQAENQRHKKRERSFDRLEAKAPASLRKIAQGRQDDDVRRIVRNADREIGVPRECGLR
jgi:hypothetical protein